VVADLEGRWGGLDGALHAIAYAPADALGGNFLNTPQDSAATAFVTSAFSFKTLAVGVLDLMKQAGGGSVVGLDFDNSTAWPAYDWMGVAKSALQSVCRYLARDLGRHRVRVNLVSSGPLRTVAARSIPGFDHLHDTWSERAPLAWDSSNPEAVARMICVLLSDWAPLTTGEVIHVDGGFHAISAAPAVEAQPTE
jgi:enoyl-[acyl-carrier protein] reductase I